MIIAGATPKETTSASESNSLPIVDFTRSKRAAKPSKKSKKDANTTIIAAIANLLFWSAMTIAVTPADKLSKVIILGICFSLIE